jgi:aspartate kinase
LRKTLNIVVQKFGGTSVGSVEKIKNVAKRVIHEVEQGNEVVVISSAMAGETDRLLSLAGEITENPPKRELDMLVATGEQVSIALLAMALESYGYHAISLTSTQVGIFTDASHTKAKITKIETDKIRESLTEGRIVIIAGFQGVDENMNITTLGRGGSDTSAVAIAAALGAAKCDIYTDVDGIYTADPRIVKDAKKLKYISYDEILELAALGAKVLHSRSVELAKKYNVPLEVRSSFSDIRGTMVVEEYENMEKIVVSGITSKKDEARVTIEGIPDRPGIAARIFSELSSEKINVNVIVQTSMKIDGEMPVNDISFTVAKNELKSAVEILENINKELNGTGVSIHDDIAIVSIVGIGMRSHAGVASKMFETLAEASINIQMITTSEIKVSVVIDVEEADKAVRLLHDAFKLGVENNE